MNSSLAQAQSSGAASPAVLLQEQILERVDEAASFQTFLLPGANGIEPVNGRAGGLIGFDLSGALHRFHIEMPPPGPGAALSAVNTVGERMAAVRMNWLLVSRNFVGRPGLRPPEERLAPSRSQRFILFDGGFDFERGQGGFHCFGAGRTFPMVVAGREKLLAVAVGNLMNPGGRFRGHDGNFTLCGELDLDRGFRGNLMFRIVDLQNNLRTAETLPQIQPVPVSDPDTTYLTWIAQKRPDLSQKNTYSYTPSKVARGINIPVDSKTVQVDAAITPQGFRSRNLAAGKVIGLEVGMTLLLETPQTDDPRLLGSADAPYQFEGVSQYTFYDANGRAMGKFTANAVEGRSFDVDMQVPAGRTALRFGYFSPIVNGEGCFQGLSGMLYGTAGSVFAPPPQDHVISNLYVARINDPEGRFRAALNRCAP